MKVPLKVLIVDLYGDGDVLRVILDTPANREAIQKWDSQDKPCDFSSFLEAEKIAEIDHEVMYLRPD